MTELASNPYHPDQAPQGVSQERLVFVDPTDRHGREFEISSDQNQHRPTIGADSPEVNAAIEDAYRIAQADRDEAAARTPEHGATDAELTKAIGWNAEAVNATRDYVEANGF